jgi:hypothetical protein
VTLSDTIIVWTVACGETTIDISEDGRLWSDAPDLLDRVRSLLTIAIDVSHSGSDGKPLVLQPTDRRYVVARVRQMVDEQPDLEIVGVRWTGEPEAQRTE